ncbi:SIMPL domain-containing protein [Colwellia sp. MSW7]|uniref:SIMPL domain-containing protein n=1 Tax=Colwellia maritima TaxID=2912588 RepID=A0ABS9X1L7_9GAMM|nr:SIMPL domain-containing protein [Colwellia maritima]MCI2284144.1 SIMPL domain-containing protein [Colwellia maritima]
MFKINTSLIRHALALSTCLILSNTAFANTQESGIEVTGQATVLVELNQFVLSISIAEKGHFTDKIRAIVDNKSNQVIDVATNIGVKPRDINSARVYLRIIKEDPKMNIQGVSINQALSNTQKGKVHLGTNSTKTVDNVAQQFFELSRNITVKFSDIDDYDRFLNAVIKIGVTHISPLTMTVDDTDKYYEQALSLAINNAKAKALQIANQAGQSLGKLVYLKEVSSNHYSARFSASRMVNSSFEHSSQIGTKEINASVLVNYSIE